jgi:hypothetical protein
MEIVAKRCSLVFVALLASISLAADYTRIAIIRAERVAFRDAVTISD